MVRCAPEVASTTRTWGYAGELGFFLGYESSKHHSYVWVRGKKLLFLTRELEKVTR